MQCTSFLPGCYSTRDPNVGANGGIWPLYDNNRTLKSGHSYNVFLPPPTADQYLGYGKEILRQTMLKHEATFRDQVHELHRLYKRQRELMDEIERKELSKHQLQLQTSESNHFLSQNSFEYSQKTWQIPSLPWVFPAGSKPSAPSAENFQAPSSCIDLKSMQAGPEPAPTEDSLNNCKLLEPKCKKSRKRMFNLELPADEYIDSEEGEGFGEEKVSEVLPKSNLKLFPCGGLFNSVCQQGSSDPNSFSRRANDLADLNEPIQLEDAATPNSIIFFGSDTCHEEIPCRDRDRVRDLFGKSTSGSQVLSKEIVHNIQRGRDVEACSKVMHLEEDRRRELLPHNDEAGKSRSNLNSLLQVSSPGKLPMPSNPLQVEHLAKHASVNVLDECDRKLWSERPNFSLETSERSNDLSSDDYPKHVSSCIPTSYQLVPQSDVAKSEQSSFSSRRKTVRNLRHNPIAVQALPCFNFPVTLSKSSKSSVVSPGLSGNKFHLSRNLRCSSSVGSVSPLGNSFSLHSQLESRTFEACLPSISVNHLNCNNANDSAPELHNLGKDVNSAKTMDLNFMPPSCLLDMTASQQIVGTADGVKKLEDLLSGLPWLRAKPDYKNKANKERGDLTPMDSGFSQALPTSVCDVESKRFETRDFTGNEKLLGSSNFDKPHVSSDEISAPSLPSSSHPSPSEDKDIENSEKLGVLDINMACNPAFDTGKQCTTDDLVVKIGVDNKLSGFGNQIDLNSCINEDESSPKLSIPKTVTKTVAEIDLEAPVSPENKECSPPRGESEENRLETPLQLSKQEHGDPQEELVRTAAEAIVLISSFRFEKLFLKNASCEPLEASPGDSLHWFASVVSSVAGYLENEVGVVLNSEDGGDHKELSSDGNDYFEAMTLKLEETKVEEDCCHQTNGQNEEETGAILSPRQPRRGRTRRGRQRKDFQTEVLPCLASLSRHEVTEDLQTIGGLMEAAGTPLETSLGRRNAGRNGCARGRRQSRIYPSNVVESTGCSLLKQQSNDGSELATGESSLTGWGKTNRRRRGQRFPASNPALIFSRVQ